MLNPEFWRQLILIYIVYLITRIKMVDMSQNIVDTGDTEELNKIQILILK